MAEYRPYGLARDDDHSSLFAGGRPFQDRPLSEDPGHSRPAESAEPGAEPRTEFPSFRRSQA